MLRIAGEVQNTAAQAMTPGAVQLVLLDGAGERLVAPPVGAGFPLDERVLDAMGPYLKEDFGNPASRSHVFGWRAGADPINKRRRLGQHIWQKRYAKLRQCVRIARLDHFLFRISSSNLSRQDVVHCGHQLLGREAIVEPRVIL